MYELGELAIQLIGMGFLVEAVVDTLKTAYKAGEGIQIPKILAIVTGLVIAFITQIDMLVALNLLETSNIAGIILTGILISRGGNFVYEFLGNKEHDNKEE